MAANPQSEWPYVCEKCGGRSILHDSRTTYEDDTHAEGCNAYICVTCGTFQFQDWEHAYEEYDYFPTPERLRVIHGR